MSTADSESTAADHGSSPALRAQEKSDGIGSFWHSPCGTYVVVLHASRFKPSIVPRHIWDVFERAWKLPPNPFSSPKAFDEPRGLSAAETPNSVDGVNNI